MCGIAGIVDFREPPDRELAAAMAEVLRHRGPDEGGLHSSHCCALAMRRLAIQDVVHGHQPVFSEDGRVVAVLNGEIYNFQALRARLEVKGHRLASSSDTEVIPHLYEEKGVGFLEDLRGMFAIALWDEQRRRLVLARDRLGKKPLFYMHHGGSLRFASEIKAFFADPSVPREPDLEAIHHYLCLQYVPAPWTAFAGIHALPPGSLLVADEDGERVERWWQLERPDVLAMDRDDAAKKVREAVQDAVSLRMIADVPLGAFLSGGVDSACVVAAMAEASTRPVRTFTLGFREQERDERASAALTAAALGTDHTELVVEPDVAGLLPLLAWHYDQPLADHASLPTYVVSRETRSHVTVALNGDGGDEAFAGYPRIQRLGGLRGRPGTTGLAARLAAKLPAGLDPASRLALARRLALHRLGPLADAYVADSEIFPERFLMRSYAPEMREAAEKWSTAGLLMDAIPPDGDGDPIWRGQAADYQTYLPGALLPKVDIASMAVSLEARSPLLDHRLVEVAAALPTSCKVGPEGSKLALRDAFRGVVPDAVLDGTKRGFGLPLEGWLRADLAPMARALLTSSTSSVGRIMSSAVIDRLLRHQESGRAHHGTRIYALLCLELWFHTYIAAPPRLVPPAEVQLSDFV